MGGWVGGEKERLPHIGMRGEGEIYRDRGGVGSLDGGGGGGGGGGELSDVLHRGDGRALKMRGNCGDEPPPPSRSHDNSGGQVVPVLWWTNNPVRSVTIIEKN